MREFLFICSLIFILSGCATISSIERNFKSINSSDGISRKEAKIIAQKQIIQINSKKDYHITNPKVYGTSEFNDDVVKKESFMIDLTNNKELYNNGEFYYPDSWHVVFHPKSSGFLSTYYLFIIDKKSGQVQYTHEKDVIAALSPIISLFKQEPMLQLHIVAVAATYYSQNNHWPSDGQELQEYFKVKTAGQDQKKNTKINFEDFKFQQTKEGYLLISQEKDKTKEVAPPYEIIPLAEDEFIVNYKEAIIPLKYVLKIDGDKITLNPYLKDNKKDSSLLWTFDVLSILFGD